jgi:hypothetical protein
MTDITHNTATMDPELYVEQWRILQYSHLGFSPEQIALCLVDGIDYHEAAKLVNAGCDHETALTILMS